MERREEKTVSDTHTNKHLKNTFPVAACMQVSKDEVSETQEYSKF